MPKSKHARRKNNPTPPAEKVKSVSLDAAQIEALKRECDRQNAAAAYAQIFAFEARCGKSELWRYADDEPSREAAVERLVKSAERADRSFRS